MKKDYVIGSSKVEDYFAFINERHTIFLNRKGPKPWTEDPILRQYKFTNVFRELDTGTIALREGLAKDPPPAQLVWTICWYRLFNWHEHIRGGLFANPQELEVYLRQVKGKIFTSAHMTTGVLGEEKLDTYMRAVWEAWELRLELINVCRPGTMEYVFEFLKQIYQVGKFVAYEIACDLRFYFQFDDVLTWANVGPGARRGLERLGMPTTLQSMRELYALSIEHLAPHVLRHHAEYKYRDKVVYPPFELREIEHCLCEFDKYERVRLGQGRPRMKYDGG